MISTSTVYFGLLAKIIDYLKLIALKDLDLRAGAVAILIALVRFSVSEFNESSPW